MKLFDDLQAKGPLYHDLTEHRLIREVVDAELLDALQNWPAVAASLKSRGNADSIRIESHQISHAPVYIIDVHHIGIDDPSEPRAVIDRVFMASSALENSFEQDDFDFLLVDCRHRLIVAMGLRGKFNTNERGMYGQPLYDGGDVLRCASIDDGEFVDRLEAGGAGAFEGVATALSDLPFDVYDVLSQEMEKFSQAMTDSWNLPSIDELDWIRSNGNLKDGDYRGPAGEEITAEEIDLQITRLQGYRDQLADSEKFLRTLFPNIRTDDLIPVEL